MWIKFYIDTVYVYFVLYFKDQYSSWTRCKFKRKFADTCSIKR